MSIDKRQQLPIGSIVKVLNESIDVAIIGQFPIVENEHGKGYYDFVGVILPVGYDAENLLFFNKEDISQIIFLGYVNIGFQRYLKEAEKFEETTELRKLTIVKKKREGGEN